MVVGLLVTLGTHSGECNSDGSVLVEVGVHMVVGVFMAVSVLAMVCVCAFKNGDSVDIYC